MVKLIVFGVLSLLTGIAMAEPITDLALITMAESGLTLTGQYAYGADTDSVEMLAGKVCFYPNATSAKLLPQPNGDRRQPWLCFSNTAQSQKLLGITPIQQKASCGISGTATVEVKNYQVYVEESDGFDTATLLSVKNNINIKINACQASTKTMKSTNFPTFKKNESYTSVRKKMLQAGWQPFHSPDADTCLKEDERCEGRMEMDSCTGTGLGNCRFLWMKSGEKTGICTIGDNAVFDTVCK